MFGHICRALRICVRAAEVKSADGESSMQVLGSRVTIDCERRGVAVDVEEDKAAAWCVFFENFEDDQMESVEAARTFGRMSFAVTITHNRVGRPFVRFFIGSSMLRFLGPLRRHGCDRPSFSDLYFLENVTPEASSTKSLGATN